MRHLVANSTNNKKNSYNQQFFFRVESLLSNEKMGAMVLAGLVLPLGLFSVFANGVTIYVIYKSPRLK